MRRRHRGEVRGRSAGLVLLGAAAVLWGSSAGAVRAFGDQTGAAGAVAAFAEVVIAAPLLIGAGMLARSPWPPANQAVPAALLTGTLVSGFLLCYFTSIGMIGVTLASLLAICSAPLFTALLAIAFLEERPSRAMLIALGLGVVGSGLVLLGQPGEVSADAVGERTEGMLLALIAGLFFGAENVVVRRLMSRFHPTQLAALTTCTIVVLLAPFALASGGVVRASVAGWPWLLYLAVLPTAIAPALHNAGLHRVPAIPASVVGLIEPLTAAALGLVLFDEALGPGGVVGAAALLLAIAILSMTQRSELTSAAPDHVSLSPGAVELEER